MATGNKKKSLHFHNGSLQYHMYEAYITECMSLNALIQMIHKHDEKTHSCDMIMNTKILPVRMN